MLTEQFAEVDAPAGDEASLHLEDVHAAHQLNQVVSADHPFLVILPHDQAGPLQAEPGQLLVKGLLV